MKLVLGLLCLCGAVAPLAVLAQGAPAPWPAPVPNFTQPAPGEHPRLLFRRADIPALRARAATPTGQAMIARLKVLLGGGEAMPERFSTEKPVNSVDEAAVARQPVGTFTLSHGAGFGLLYVLTGEQKYADLARECVDKIFAGQVDRDSRYNWATPGTGFRMSFVLQSICLAYDLCGDAWPADYRRQVVERVMATRQPKVDDPNKFYTLEELANCSGYPPGSNHFGAYLLGPGLVALTFTGEPGADDARLAKVLTTVEKNLDKLLGGGFGDHGWFAEGTSCGRIASNNGVIPLLQSLKVAAGKDYITPRPNGRYTVLRFMHEIVPTGDSMNEKAGKYYPVPSRPLLPHRGDYGDNNFYQRPIISHLGDFAQGMGAVEPREAQAMLWVYDHFIEPGAEKTWNATVYPHLAIYAFVNWPETALDPDEVLPHVLVDDIHGYYVARNRWEDKDDIVVTTLLKRGPGGYKSGKVAQGTYVWGLGEKLVLPRLAGKTSYFRAGEDGSMELADEKGSALAVDYSGAAGVPGLIAVLGEMKPITTGKARVTVLKVGDIAVSVMTLSTGAQPTPQVVDQTITVGEQTIRVEPGKLTLARFTDAK